MGIYQFISFSTEIYEVCVVQPAKYICLFNQLKIEFLWEQKIYSYFCRHSTVIFFERRGKNCQLSYDQHKQVEREKNRFRHVIILSYIHTVVQHERRTACDVRMKVHARVRAHTNHVFTTDRDIYGLVFVFIYSLLHIAFVGHSSFGRAPSDHDV